MIGARIGSYRVVSAVGGGGVAQVYRVQHTLLETWHALKVLRAPSDRARQRLVAEGRIQAGLRHPNVVQVTDVLEVDGVPALLMELVEGPTLAALIGAGLRRPDVIDTLAAGVLDGVAAAHALGLVHRDLKPGNVLVAVEGDRWVPKVADFGLARALAPDDARLTRTGAALGTPLYMAPEQIRDARTADQRSDVWALGVLLHELVTGSTPFEDAGDRLELYRRIDEARPTPLGELRADAPPRWQATVAAALQRDPAARPAEAGALRALWGPVTPVTVDDEARALLTSLTPGAGAQEPLNSPETFGLSLDGGPTPPTFVPSVAEEPVATPPAPELPASASRSVELPASAPEAAPPARWPSVVLGLVAAGVGSALTAWWLAAPPAVVAVGVPPEVPEVPAVPVPEAPPTVDRIERNRLAQVAKARDLLLDGEGTAAALAASMVAAGASTDSAALMQGAGALLDGRWGGSWEELGRARDWDDPTSRPGTLLRATVTPSVADALGTDPAAELQTLWLIGRPSRRGQGRVDAARAWASQVPGRPLPQLVLAAEARRSGAVDVARAAVDAAGALGPRGARWALEAGLQAAEAGDAEAAFEVLDAAVAAADPRPPPALWAARGWVDARFGRGAALATDLDGMRRGSAYDAAAFRLAVADGYAASGDLAAALEQLELAEAGLEPYGRNGDVNWLRVQVHTERLRLALAAGDEATVRAVVPTLQALAEGPMIGWAEAEATRRAAAGEAVLAWRRGVPGPLEALRAELTRAPDVPVVLAELVDEVAAGEVVGRVHPSLRP